MKKLLSIFTRRKEETIVFDQKRVLILASGRTGSTLLEDLLQSTGYFKAHGELFRPSEPIQKNPLDYFIDLANQCDKKHFISHVKIYQMESVVQSALTKREFLLGLIENGWQIVYITRSNKVRHNLSSFRAQETNVFHTNVALAPIPLEIDCYKFAHGIHQLLRWEQEERELLEEIPFVEIQYERHLENGLSHQSAVKTVLNYVGLPHRAASTHHKKVVRGELHELILNYEEFRDEMTANGFGHFLV